MFYRLSIKFLLLIYSQGQLWVGRNYIYTYVHNFVVLFDLFFWQGIIVCSLSYSELAARQNAAQSEILSVQP